MPLCRNLPGSLRRAAGVCLLLLAVGATADETRLSAAQALSDLRLLQRAFAELHPGLYRHATPAAIDAEFETARSAVAGGASRTQMYLLVSRLAAAVRCGHTWTNPSNQRPAVVQGVLDRADKLPLELRAAQGRLLVTASATAAVAPGTELEAIDDRPVAALMAELLPYLRADGDNDGKRLAQVDSGPGGGAMDRYFPLLHPPRDGHYRLRLRDRDELPAREVVVEALRERERRARMGAAPPSTAWRFTIEGDTGRLEIPTMAFWNGGFDAPVFLDRVFADLAERQLPYLIIDQRRNEGGDRALVDAVLAHLIQVPHVVPGGRRESAYERVPYALARHLDTWDDDFFDRTGRVMRGPGHRWILPASPPRTIVPAARAYAGRVVLLVGPRNSSAGFLLARDVQAAGAATLVGRETGGHRGGLNGGELAWLTLPFSEVAVDIPLIAHYTDDVSGDGGVRPGLVVPLRFDDLVSGVDADLAAARALIDRWRRGD